MINGTFRGSEWRKWDFHIHTPFSFTHHFEGNYSNETSSEFQKSYDNYVKTLFSKAIENDIAAIGITDYFRIDGYKKIRTEYLDNDEKLLELFNKDTVDKIKQIFVFPNIEMRLNCFVGRDCENIDFHVIFSDEISVEVIEENFIKKLEFLYDTPFGNTADKRSISPINIKAFGEKLKQEQGFVGDELTVGYEHLTLDINDIIKVLQEISDFKDKYLTIVDDDNLGNIPWGGRDHSIRKAIVKRSNLQFSNNKSNIDWGLGLRGYDTPSGFLEEFGHFLPSVTGSDAHSYDKMFVLDNEQYCWIKANANFEGLRQIIFEPSERVKIQTTKPEEKNSDKVIDRIEINDPNFTAEPIYLSENLTCIIGGKSTGKSLLLREIAKVIDLNQVINREKEVYDKPKKGFKIENVHVFWKDGSQEHEKRKIVYIPQTYLNRLTDEEQETTQIDKLIEKVLFQNPVIYEGYDNLCKKLQKVKESTGKKILEYNSHYNQYSNLKEQLKENGDSKTIGELILEIQTKIDEIAKKLNISETIIDRYNLSKSKIALLDSQAKDISLDILQINDSVVLDSLQDEIEDVLKKLKVPEVKELYSTKAKKLLEELEKQWTVSKIELINELESIKITGEKERSELKRIVDELQPTIEKTEEIKELSKKKLIEEERKKRAEKIEAELIDIINEKDKLQYEINNISLKYKAIYDEYISIVSNAAANFPNSDMTFNANAIFRKDKFIETILNTFNKKTLISEVAKQLRDEPENIPVDNFINILPQKIFEDFEAEKIKPVRDVTFETVLRNLYDDWFNIDYSINMGRDNIKNMSPGKKALVLLRLLLELAQSDFPILIDQPEDDLDNRSIYNDIVKYIKSKKKERQIIVVTHNANVVLGSDSELVIIANQDGEDCKNNTARFEYRCGAIENNNVEITETEEKKSGILYETGVRNQICDILEGGSDAFNLRENKYSII
jgi:ABC-type cobalamin/Fe3+-siderophores transport system ATPase subunit